MSKYIDVDKYRQDLIQLGFLPALVVRVLDKQPAADVEEVRHGHWIKTNSKLAEMTCSLCGFTYYGEHDIECMSTFCPECGAKMDGERREE